MIFLFGESEREKILDSGAFYCPVCKGTAQYEDVEHKSWFTCFFIPTLPLKTMAFYRQCNGCSNTFDIDSPTQPEYSQTQLYVCVTLASILISELGKMRAEALYQKIYQHLFNQPLPVTLEHCEQLSQTHGGSMFDQLESARTTLNWHGKLLIIKASYLAIAGVRDLNDQDKVGLNMIGTSMDVDMSVVKQVIQQTPLFY
ncbi:MAG: RNA polymerase subunit RPABC4/transcription elongation factor Spt4 [Phenylobacterium sp.]|jgi:RNA polymerase subunit RPABC4/transcription elongation factor Spt4